MSGKLPIIVKTEASVSSMLALAEAINKANNTVEVPRNLLEQLLQTTRPVGELLEGLEKVATEQPSQSKLESRLSEVVKLQQQLIKMQGLIARAEPTKIPSDQKLLENLVPLFQTAFSQQWTQSQFKHDGNERSLQGRFNWILLQVKPKEKPQPSMPYISTKPIDIESLPPITKNYYRDQEGNYIEYDQLTGTNLILEEAEEGKEGQEEEEEKGDEGEGPKEKGSSKKKKDDTDEPTLSKKQKKDDSGAPILSNQTSDRAARDKALREKRKKELEDLKEEVENRRDEEKYIWEVFLHGCQELAGFQHNDELLEGCDLVMNKDQEGLQNWYSKRCAANKRKVLDSSFQMIAEKIPKTLRQQQQQQGSQADAGSEAYWEEEEKKAPPKKKPQKSNPKDPKPTVGGIETRSQKGSRAGSPPYEGSIASPPYDDEDSGPSDHPPQQQHKSGKSKKTTFVPAGGSKTPMGKSALKKGKKNIE